MSGRRSHALALVTSLAVVGALSTITPAWAAPPANDNFANRQVIAGAAGSVAGTTVEATGEPGEFSAGAQGAINSVWYSWTAPSSGLVTFNTCTTANYDTFLAAYAATASVPTTAPITSNDDACVSFRSSITFGATSGTVYSIALDGFSTGTGTATIDWNLVPAPDLVASKSGPAQVTAGQSYNYTIGVTNSGTAQADNVSLTDTLPAGVTFVSASPGCSEMGGTVTCAVGSLAPGASAQYTITVTPNLTNPFGTSLVNSVTASTSTPEITTSNNTATSTATQSGCTTNVGTSGNDVICPKPSGSTVQGGAGNDVLYGSPSGDTLQGGDGDDVIFGGAGNDTIQGGNGNDTMFGDDGNDTLQGMAGTDTANGGAGYDTCQTSESTTSCP